MIRNEVEVVGPTAYESGVPINISIGTSTVGVWNYTIFANDIAGNVASDEVIVTITLPYVPPIEGDVNQDGKVDFSDLAAVASAFNTREGMPNWNPAADLNQDGIVDIFDLVEIGKNFSKRSSPWD